MLTAGCWLTAVRVNLCSDPAFERTTMHRIFTISELVRRIIEEYINTKPALSIANKHKALIQLACVEPFSFSALDILWKDASIRQLQALTGFQDRLVALTVEDASEEVTIPQNSPFST
jgi:hypothetical protein